MQAEGHTRDLKNKLLDIYEDEVHKKEDGSIYIKIKGIANFINIIKLNKLLLDIPKKVVVNMGLGTDGNDKKILKS